MVTDGAKGGLEPGFSEAQVAAIRRAEQEQAGKVLGVADIIWLGFQDTEVPKPETVREPLISLIREVQPDFVISLDPWLPYEAHPDHRRASMAAVEACLFAGLPMIQPEDMEHGLVPWQVTGIALALSLKPNTFIGIDATWEKKLEAIKCHRSHPLPHLGHVLPADTGQVKRIREQCKRQGRRSIQGTHHYSPSCYGRHVGSLIMTLSGREGHQRLRNMKTIRLAVIGGGSSYTPELIDGLIKRWEDNEFLAEHLALIDIPQGRDRLEVVGGFVQRMIEKAGMPCKVTRWTDIAPGLEGADFVISQIRVGGMKARQTDEHIPAKYGIVGQETTGPGGFACALRTIPAALSIAEAMQRTCPNAWLLNFTNPSGIVTEALLKHTQAKVFGLCNVPISIKMEISQALGVEHQRLSVDVSGLNHLSFVTGLYLDGADVMDQVMKLAFA